MQICQGKGALDQLRQLGNSLRNSLLSNKLIDRDDLAHTVLPPLDMNIYAVGDIDETELFNRRCNLVFDTVLSNRAIDTACQSLAF